jgi:DegV family protein with EDD domain
MLDTLEYLQKGGRIGKAQAFVGSMLNVRPILRLQDGEVLPVERPRNRERARRRLVELVRGLAPVRQMTVLYSTDQTLAQSTIEELRDMAPEEGIIEARFGPILGVYLGPNALGIAVTRRPA